MTEGETTEGATTDPGEPQHSTAGSPQGVHDLHEMIGHYLSVHVTYVHEDGKEEEVRFVGAVKAVEPLVAVHTPGAGKPFTLPPDPKCYREITRVPEPDAWSEGIANPRYETTWKVRRGSQSTRDPEAGPFRPGTTPA